MAEVIFVVFGTPYYEVDTFFGRSENLLIEFFKLLQQLVVVFIQHLVLPPVGSLTGSGQ